MAKLFNNINAILFNVSEDLELELMHPLRGLLNSDSIQRTDKLSSVASSSADVIFCRNSVDIVHNLRSARPEASIVVVSRHPEVGDWLDSLEAGASDYCAAPFEKTQMEWILETSLRAVPATA